MIALMPTLCNIQPLRNMLFFDNTAPDSCYAYTAPIEPTPHMHVWYSQQPWFTRKFVYVCTHVTSHLSSIAWLQSLVSTPDSCCTVHKCCFFISPCLVSTTSTVREITCFRHAHRQTDTQTNYNNPPAHARGLMMSNNNHAYPLKTEAYPILVLSV